MLRHRRFIGEPERYGKFLIDLQPDSIRQRATAPVMLVGDLDGRLQNGPRNSVHVKLAAGEPPQIGRIGRIEQQQRSLTVFRRQFQQHAPLLIFEFEFEARLARDVLDELRVQFQHQQFVPASLEHLHDKAILAAGILRYRMVLHLQRDLVLFDFDGTLVRRAGPHHRQALIDAVRRATGVETTTEGVPVQGMLDRDILACMLANAGISRARIRQHMPAMVTLAQRIYVRTCPDLRRRVCPGARMLLYRLWRKRIPAGLVTGNLTRIGWKKMERAGLKRYLRFGAFAELAPDRAGLVRIALRHARRQGWMDGSSRVALIGDHPNDIRAARANGVRSIAVATGLVSADELARHAPDVLVPDLRALSMEMLLG